MTPTYARGSKGTHYRYYVSASLQQGGKISEDGIVRRIGAPQFEKVIAGIIERWSASSPSPLELPLGIHLQDEGLLIDMPGNMASDIAARLHAEERILHSSKDAIRIRVPLVLPLRGGRPLVVAGDLQARPDSNLIAALRKAHSMMTLKRGQPLIETAPVSPHDRKLLRLAFLAPDLQHDILTGRQPLSLNLEKLRYLEIPLCWSKQRELLGWPPRG